MRLLLLIIMNVVIIIIMYHCVYSIVIKSFKKGTNLLYYIYFTGIFSQMNKLF